MFSTRTIFRIKSGILGGLPIRLRLAPMQCLGAIGSSRELVTESLSTLQDSPGTLRLTLTTKPWIRISSLKKTVYHSFYFATCNRFFAYRTAVLGLFKLNVKARHEIPDDESYRIRHRLELNIFTSTIFAQCSSSSSSTLRK